MADLANGQFVINNADNTDTDYSIGIALTDGIVKKTFSHEQIAISSTDTHYLKFGLWNGQGPMQLQVDRGSDGTIDQTIILKNTANDIHLPIIQR
jgi:hypothetical protein